jgi:KUP system potassium uptake protein
VVREVSSVDEAGNEAAAPAQQASGFGLLVAATGVVYGDIGTSPLYTLKEVFSGHYGVSVDHAGVLGILSLICWSLLWVVSVKYVLFVLRADNQGEGGAMALLALAQRAARPYAWLSTALGAVGLCGAALFYGDSMITPAISVMSAIEGVEIAFEGVGHWVIPLALVVLVGLFLLQKHGTAHLGMLFGPVMVGWFVVLGILGLHGIARQPVVLQALNPYWAVHFFAIHPGVGLTVLGAVVLALTGAEALYADLGHFGRRPIARAWFFLVLPALLLNYFGQGALLLDTPEAARNPFYLLAPAWALLPLIGLATLATIIASQAVISGAFSLTRQAIQLGYVPRMLIQHTSEHMEGQIYIAVVNRVLLVGVVLLVLGFGSSSALASAYGVAVTGTMLCTSLLVAVVMLLQWKLPWWQALPLLIGFLVVDSLFFLACLPKVLEGGAFPLLVGIVLFALMTTWKRGRQTLYRRLGELALPLPIFIESLLSQPPPRVRGTAVFLAAHPESVPPALLHNLQHNQVLHERVVLLTVLTLDCPRVAPHERAQVETSGQGFYRVLLSFGFMDKPDVPAALRQLSLDGTTYFLSRETLIPGPRPEMARWRTQLFAFLQRNANSSLHYFQLPANRVVELGSQVQL